MFGVNLALDLSRLRRDVSVQGRGGDSQTDTISAKCSLSTELYTEHNVSNKKHIIIYCKSFVPTLSDDP